MFNAKSCLDCCSAPHGQSHLKLIWSYGVDVMLVKSLHNHDIVSVQLNHFPCMTQVLMYA